jgi:lysophospholipase L1-like esterase
VELGLLPVIAKREAVPRSRGARLTWVLIGLVAACASPVAPPLDAVNRVAPLPHRDDDVLTLQQPAAPPEAARDVGDGDEGALPPPTAPLEEDLVFLVPSAMPESATVLHIGDSFAGALGSQLNVELQRRGMTGILEFETGTFIATWASKRRLGRYLARHRPDLVLITLGANELNVRRPESRALVIRKLVAALGGRPCVWIAPPLWEDAKPGLLRVIEDNCAPCAYLDSNALVPDLERLRDKIHPSAAGRARWAKAVMAWLDQHPVRGLEPNWVRLDR